MTLPLCTVCESPDVVAVEPGIEGETFSDLFAVVRPRPDRAWCAACWPWSPERVAGEVAE